MGIKKEEKESYVEWKKWGNIIPPDSILKTIYFPVKYDKSLSVYKKEGILIAAAELSGMVSECEL